MARSQRKLWKTGVCDLKCRDRKNENKFKNKYSFDVLVEQCLLYTEFHATCRCLSGEDEDEDCITLLLLDCAVRSLLKR